MEYTQLSPGPALTPFIHCYWFLSGASASAELQPIVPDGRIELVLNLGARFLRHHAAGSVERQPSCIVAGQMTEAVLVEPSGSVDLVGVRFTSAGASGLGLPVRELRGVIVEAGLVGRWLEQDLGGRLQEAEGVRARVRVLDAHFAAMRMRPPSHDVAAAVDLIAASEGRARVDEVAARLGMSSRTLERRFDAAVGLPPKVFARIVRFQRAFRLMQTSGPGAWSRVAHTCGYFDQAHLNREFVRFAGTSPTRFFSGQTVLADFLSRDDRAGAA